MRAVSIAKGAPVDGNGPTSLQQMLRDAVRAEIGGVFEELRRFVDRRIAELSTELHAALEMVDVSEHHLSDQLQQMHGTLSRVATSPASTTRNSRLRLEDLVQATEDAANNIMTAAEMIRSALDAPDAREVILEQVGAILDACRFRDLTWQRVRRTLEQLRAESMLAPAAEATGAEIERERPEPSHVGDIAADGPELSQDEINRLFS
jgi:chemotaxis protein CheZ